MERTILLVDDQRDILRLLHSALDSLKNEKIRILEAPSGEEALLESTRYPIDLLVADYKLPGMSGVELMHKIRARHPAVKVIFITAMTNKSMREEMLNAGALAIFDKPIPMADFLDMVERGLGFMPTIFPQQQTTDADSGRYIRLSDLLANFRQDVNAEAVFLINDRGLIQARTGALRDPSMELSLISALMAIHSASLKVARFNHQEALTSYHVFSSGDHDLLFIPVTPLYALLVAGNGLVTEDRILEVVGGLLSLRAQVEKALVSLGVTGELKDAHAGRKSASSYAPKPAAKPQTDKLARAAPAPDLEALFAEAARHKPQNVDEFWNEAVQKHGSKTANPDVISYEEARKLGIIPEKK